MKMTVSEIKEKLQSVETTNDPFYQTCLLDERKGVQVAVKQWLKKQAAEQKILERFEMMNQYETAAQNYGYEFVAGIDEVGRGPLAGPVVSAAVILDMNKPIIGLNDSKKLSLRRRNELFEEIKVKAVAIGVGILTAEEIDEFNILGATKLAMKEAALNLSQEPDLLLVDAVKIDTPIPQEMIIKGDMKSNSIAAASIIAKVTRDNMMIEYDQLYPGYGFKNNAGYGTKEHLEGLELLGPTPIHRKSFAPVKQYL